MYISSTNRLRYLWYFAKVAMSSFVLPAETIIVGLIRFNLIIDQLLLYTLLTQNLRLLLRFHSAMPYAISLKHI